MSRATSVGRAAASVLRWVLLAAVHAYRLVLSPLLGGACRFEPSCSAYAEEAIRIHGPFRGGVLSARRVLRCHPFGAMGHDPVPLGKSDGA